MRITNKVRLEIAAKIAEIASLDKEIIVTRVGINVMVSKWFSSKPGEALKVVNTICVAIFTTKNALDILSDLNDFAECTLLSTK